MVTRDGLDFSAKASNLEVFPLKSLRRENHHQQIVNSYFLNLGTWKTEVYHRGENLWPSMFCCGEQIKWGRDRERTNHRNIC